MPVKTAFPFLFTLLATASFVCASSPAQAQEAPPLPAPPLPKPIPAPRPDPLPYPASETPDYLGARWEAASPFNFAAHDPAVPPRTVDVIVIHDIEGSALSAVRWFQNPAAKVTSHYVVAGDGVVYQQVKERDVAWHAGNRNINGRSVGIEHEGFAYRPGFYNSNEYEASARLVRSIALRHNIPRDRAHIFGHAEVPNASDPTKFGGGSGHTDPGPYWDWETFMALVRNDAVFATNSPASPAQVSVQGMAPGVSVKLRPGEKGQATFLLTNTGDDEWLADTVPPRPNPELRKSGPVYLGLANLSNNAPLLPGWISPRFAAAPTGGDVAPNQTASFTVPLTGAAFAGGEISHQMRLWKVFQAPHPAAAFGPTVSATVFTVPWDITAPLPYADPPMGWNAKTLPSTNENVFWRNTNAKTDGQKPGVVSWQTPLPTKGAWDVYVRLPQSLNNAARRADAAYFIPGPNGQSAKVVTLPQNAPEEDKSEWKKLGRFVFDVPPPAPTTAAGVRPGAKLPDVPVVFGTVSLLPTPAQNGKSGILTAGDVRFVGPFAPNGAPQTNR